MYVVYSKKKVLCLLRVSRAHAMFVITIYHHVFHLLLYYYTTLHLFIHVNTHAHTGYGRDVTRASNTSLPSTIYVCTCKHWYTMYACPQARKYMPTICVHYGRCITAWRQAPYKSYVRKELTSVVFVVVCARTRYSKYAGKVHVLRSDALYIRITYYGRTDTIHVYVQRQ